MTDYYKQLYRHKPEREILGDCYRTCIANIFRMRPWEVPHFNLSHEPDRGVDDWLEERGHNIYYFQCGGDIDNALDQLSRLAPGVVFIFSGESLTRVNHAVLAKDGAIIHDPSLTDAGIIGPLINDEVYLAEFLLPEMTKEMKALYSK